MELQLGARRSDVTHRALVMGILNRTTDSFYDRVVEPLPADPRISYRRLSSNRGLGAALNEDWPRPGPR
ncbi:MAG TPA: hypothetical protein VG452_09890 [Egibacteraceae bacterium]|nr:hypothetical protein [Actinomycetota bacterium]HWB72519.1 hypothetical protein [Egibacteraceae bacterium]